MRNKEKQILQFLYKKFKDLELRFFFFIIPSIFLTSCSVTACLPFPLLHNIGLSAADFNRLRHVFPPGYVR